MTQSYVWNMRIRNGYNILLGFFMMYLMDQYHTTFADVIWWVILFCIGGLLYDSFMTEVVVWEWEKIIGRDLTVDDAAYIISVHEKMEQEKKNKGKAD